MSLTRQAGIGRHAWILVAAALSFSVGCGGYAKVSPTAYEYAKALVSISNRQASAQLPALRDNLQQSHAAGELSDQEVNWLEAMVEDAEAGRWSAAESAARQLMMDQVQTGTR